MSEEYNACRCETFGLDKSECRNKIDFPEDNDCVLVSVDKYGELTLRECAERLGVSYVRVKQIQDKAMRKLAKLKEDNGL